MWLHLIAGAFVLVPGLLALQAWRFLRLTATPFKERLRGLPRCSAAELGRLKPGARAVVEGQVRPARPGAPLPGVAVVRRRVFRRGARTREAWRERPSTPPLRLATPEGTVVLTNEDYVLHFPRSGEDSSAGAPKELREGEVACALVSLVEKEGREARARAEWLYAGSLARCVSELPEEARMLRRAVVALAGTAALSAGVWGWLSWGLSRPTW